MKGVSDNSVIFLWGTAHLPCTVLLHQNILCAISHLHEERLVTSKCEKNDATAIASPENWIVQPRTQTLSDIESTGFYGEQTSSYKGRRQRIDCRWGSISNAAETQPEHGCNHFSFCILLIFFLRIFLVQPNNTKKLWYGFCSHS